ncbi:MAG: DEAD/DEAH box helicase [Candidatus Methanoplasma sp.]|nr:DEAD/DEAH box helicase [Candidatus Methanoplasma sp.]
MTEPTEEWTPNNEKLAEQYRFYMGLSAEEKAVVNRLVSIVRVPQNLNVSGKISGKGVRMDVADKVIEECLANGIAVRPYGAVRVDSEFALFILPFLNPRPLFDILTGVSNYDVFSLTSTLRYLLLFLDADGIADGTSEEDLDGIAEGMKVCEKGALLLLSNVFDYPYYAHLLPRMDQDVLEDAMRLKFSTDAVALKDVRGLAYTTYGVSSGLPASYGALRGDLRTMVADGRTESDRQFAAGSMMFLTEDDDAGAIECFDKGMKLQNPSCNDIDASTFPLWMLYSLCVHLNMSPFEYGPALERMDRLLSRLVDGWSHSLSAVCKHFLRPDDSSYDAGLLSAVKRDDTGYSSIFAFIALYLTGSKGDDRVSDRILEHVNTARKNGHTAIALEAAYALSRMSDRSDAKEAYDLLRGEAGFDPALSHFHPLEKWALNLDRLMTIMSKDVMPDADAKNAVRIAYEVDPERWDVQPMLQKRKARGGWSSGRKMLLTDMGNKHRDSMTEQDGRIAKCLTRSHDWGNRLAPKGTIFKEMVGHPNLLLKNTGIPLELVPGAPDVMVRRTANGYEVGTDVANIRDNISLVKETNARYKVIDLSDKQAMVISAIRGEKIVVPEEGAEKLVQTVKALSSFATVHSDLVQGVSQDAETVEPDSRIRVRITPAGGGLNAEFFIRPFNDLPPYLKPGVGGKTVVCNHDGRTLRANRDLELERSHYDALMADIRALESMFEDDGLISIGDPLDSLDLLEVLKRHEDISVTEWPEGERFKIWGAADFQDLSLRLKSGGDWFDLEGDLTIDGMKVMTMRELLDAASKSRRRFVELGNGEFLALSKQLKRQLDQLSAVANTKDGVRVNRFAMASVGELMDSVDSLRNDAAWVDLRSKIGGKVEEEMPDGLNGELRPYQADGFRWMARLSAWGAGACLADDMGLGKTVQAICMLLRDSRSGPGLVVSPVSVIPNWIGEVRKFAPGLNPVTLPVDGRKGAISSLRAGDVLITSYGLLQSEEKLLASREWAVAVLDEAHSIKNYATKTSKAAMSIRASFKLILTGTPVQNNLSEAWSLFNFINPGMLGSLSGFSDRFISGGEEGRRHLKKLIAPFILRRTKSSVLDELPSKTEIVKKIRLTDEEAAFYEAVRQQAVERLDDCDDASGSMRVLAEITRLRQASCNPRLVDPGSDIQSSKMSAFMDIVRELAGNGHRSLVFSQFVTHLSLARAELDAEKIDYLYLDGSTPTSERGRLVDRFQSGEAVLFLISLKAGGLGLNLTGADFVIHLDPWWNPAVEDQASDRAYRIGQTRPVTVYRLVGENTIEEKIIRLHSTKRDLADSLLEGSDKVAGLSVKELRKLIEDM